MTDVFVYGTLLDQALVEELTGRQCETKDATLKGCYIERNAETGYFEIHEDQTEPPAKGKVLLGLDEASLKKLDAYEGDLYVRGSAQAKIVGVDRLMDVDVYVPKLPVSWGLRWLLSAVGGEIKYDLGNPRPLREKCKSSLTSVGLVFVLNVGVLAGLLVSQLEFGSQVRLARWHERDIHGGLALVGFAVFLSWITDGFRKNLGWTFMALLVPMLHHLPGVPVPMAFGVSASSVLLLGAMGILLVSALMLVVSFEFYDSGVNAYLAGRSVRNLEYNGSRFYFCALWFTILGVVLLIASQAWQLGVIAVFAWCLTVLFVVKFEKTMEV